MVTVQLLKYKSSSDTLNHIYNNLNVKQSNYSSIVKGCLKITPLSREIDSLKLGKESEFPDKYKELINQNEALMNQLSALTGYGIDGIDFGAIYVDAVSKEIIYALNDNTYGACSDYGIKVNSKPVRYSYKDEYAFPKTDSMHLEYKKYFPDFDSWSVDSVVCVRKFKLK
jgi:hypothetical protein